MMRPVFQCLWLIIFLGPLALFGSAIVSSLAAINLHRIPSSSLWELGSSLSGFAAITYTNILRPLIIEWQAQRNTQMVSRKTMKIWSEGVSVHDSLDDIMLSWQQIVAIVDDRDCFYLFLEQNNAFAVPKRAFNSSTEACAFFNAALAYWRQAKGIVPPPALDVSGVWPPAPRVGDSQELGETLKH